MVVATDGWPEQDTAEGRGRAATPREPTDAPMRTGDEQEEAGAEASKPADSLTPARTTPSSLLRSGTPQHKQWLVRRTRSAA